jgi:hypothetical protein
MSSQFVQESNQNMLWKIVSSTSQLTDFFKMLPPGSKEEWFKGIIHQIYGETYGRNVPLRDINKRALDAMTESIKAQKRRQQGQHPIRQEQTQQPYQSPQQYQQQHALHQSQQQSYQTQGQTQHPYQTQGHLPQPSIQSSAAFRDSRESQMMDQFNRRQSEYESMTKKPVPTPVFNESIKDEAIQDLSKAVSEYMSLRDADMPPGDTLVKPMTSVVPTTSANTTTSVVPTTRIQISDPISISLEEHEPTTHKKQVQWGENTEHLFDKTQSIYESALMKQIQTLEERMELLTHTVELMIQKFDAMTKLTNE